MKKADITTRWGGYDYNGWPINRPAINVKWSPYIWGAEFKAALVACRAEFDIEHDIDVEESFSDSDLQGLVDFVREVQWSDASADVKELWSDWGHHNVKVYSDGRFGGWMVVHDLPRIEEWDAIMIARWAKTVRYVKSYLDDCDHQLAWQVCSEFTERAQMLV